MWWWNSVSQDYFYEETGSKQVPVKKFGGCCSNSSGFSQSDDEASTATGGDDSISVGPSSFTTDMTHPHVPTATVTGSPRLTIIDEIDEIDEIDKDQCTHRAFYNNMYTARLGTHEPPSGDFLL